MKATNWFMMLALLSNAAGAVSQKENLFYMAIVFSLCALVKKKEDE